METRNLEAIIGEIKPLDLIFFKGIDYISKAVLDAEQLGLGHDDFSHIGLIINKEILPSIKELEPDIFYIWESTSSSSIDPTRDIEDNKRHFGVQIRPLREVIEVYSKVEGGSVMWAQLIDNPWNNISQRNFLISEMDKIHNYFGRRTYEANFLSLLAVVFPRLRRIRNLVDILCIDGYKLFTSWKNTEGDLIGPPNIPIAGWLFCSELIAIIYQNIGILDKSLDARDMAPVDFLGIREPYKNLTKTIYKLQI